MLKYKTKGNKRGFTLVELVIVIAVIAILAAVLIPTFTNLIENANQSADTQLVANMNTVIATDLDDDTTALPENIRKVLKDNGLDDISTKSKNNVIVYNKNTKRFEKLDLAHATFKAKDSASVSVMDDGDNALVLDPDAYTIEEVFQGYVIVSTSGNTFAEALYSLRNLPDGSHNQQVQDSSTMVVAKVMQQITKEDKTDDKIIRSTIRTIMNSTYYVAASGEVFNFYFHPNNNENESRWMSWQTSWGPAKPKTKVIFNENVTSLDFSKIAGTLNGKLLSVVLPKTVEKLDLSTVDWTGKSFDGVLFYGNTSIISESEKAVLAQHGAEVANVKFAEVKDVLSDNEVAPLISKTKYYLVNKKTSSNNTEYYYDSIKQALEDAGTSAKYSGLTRTVILADSEYTVSENITIPQNVIFGVPYLNSEDYKALNTGLSEEGYPNGGFFLGVGFSEGESLKRRFFYFSDDKNSPIYENYTFPTTEPSIVDDGLKSNDNYAYKNNDYNKFNLIINTNVTVTIENGGELLVGGVLSYVNAQNYQGHVAGYYGQITNKGKIVVENGGTLRVFGYIKDEGTITAEPGSKVYEPLVVSDYLGQHQTEKYATNYAAPFMRYALPNIQNKLTVQYGATVYIYCALGAASAHNIIGTTAVLIGYLKSETDKVEGLINMTEQNTENNTIVIDYSNAGTLVNDSDNEACATNIKGDIGLNTFTINATVNTGALSVAGLISTSNRLFPIPYNFKYIIDGTFNVYNHFMVLPGATVQVNAGGTLNVTDGAEFYVADYVYQANGIDGKKYPTAEQLTTAGYSASGMLIVNGTMNIGAAKVGGIVRCNSVSGTPTLKISSDANLAGGFAVGGKLDDSTDNSCDCTCPLRIMVNGTLTDLSNENNKGNGKTYTVTNSGNELKSVDLTGSVTSGGAEHNYPEEGKELEVESYNWSEKVD